MSNSLTAESYIRKTKKLYHLFLYETDGIVFRETFKLDKLVKNTSNIILGLTQNPERVEIIGFRLTLERWQEENSPFYETLEIAKNET